MATNYDVQYTWPEASNMSSSWTIITAPWGKFYCPSISEEIEFQDGCSDDQGHLTFNE